MKISNIIYGLFLFLGSLAYCNDPTFEIIEDLNTLAIDTPELQEVKREKIRLSNGLEALLISDPDAHQSGASLAVEVGSWSDLDEFPGTAHFLEHLLFLGTEKYPTEGEYSQVVRSNEGSLNAYTSGNQTVYTFSVANGALPEVLDRFSHFFIDPLFNPSGVNRELNAIEGEFRMYQNSDGWRAQLVSQQNVNPQHPGGRFSIGNLETLSDMDPEDLKVWYREHYSANLMHLVVYSNKPMDELREMVARDFSPIVNYEHQAFRTDLAFLSQKEQGKMVYVKPLQDLKTLRVIWEVPKKFGEIDGGHPMTTLGYVLGHEGEGSLLAYLKKEGLARGLGAGGSYTGENHALFSVTINLTSEGVLHSKRVLNHLFEALHSYERDGILKEIFDEVVTIDTLDYRFQPRPEIFSYVESTAAELIREDLATYPLKTFLPNEYDSEEVKELLGLLKPSTGHYLMMAPEKLTGVQTRKTEPWMGTAYAVKDIPKSELSQWARAAPNPAIHTPRPNVYMPENLAIVNPQQDEFEWPIPQTLVDSPSGIFYFAPDQNYGLPMVYWQMRITSPLSQSKTALQQVLKELYVHSVGEALNKTLYEGNMAGLSAGISSDKLNVEVSLYGYNDKLGMLLQQVLKGLREARPTKREFELYKDHLLTSYKNFEKENSVQQGFEIVKNVFNEDFVTNRSSAKALEEVDYKTFLDYLDEFYEESYITGLAYGNMQESQALETWKEIQGTLVDEPYPVSKHRKAKVLELPKNKGPFLIRTKVKSQGNAAILTIENGDYSFTKRAAQRILSSGISQYFFGDLRTKQQTGYMVQSFDQDVERQLLNSFLALSNTHDPRDLLARFELSIETFLREMKTSTLTEEQFEQIKAAQVEQLEKPPKSIGEMGEQLSILAFDFDGDFEWSQKRIQGYKDLSYEEFLCFAQETLGSSNPRRLAVLVKGRLETPVMQYSGVSKAERLHQMGTFNTRKPVED